jgi:hypothetical protein
MSMRPAYVTLADPTLTHQVVFTRESNTVNVSCNCRKTDTGGHEPMGVSDGSISRARTLYNDPKMHSKPFAKEDEAKW